MKEAEKQKEMRMQKESCLTLVRRFYSDDHQFTQKFVEEHPTSDKNRLTNKILSMMMIECTNNISIEQNNALQAYKYTPLDLEPTKYESLIRIDWDSLQYKGNPDDEAAKKPIEMTQVEGNMSIQVEELSEDLKRENEEEIRSGVGKTSLAFIELTQISLTAKIATLIAAVLLFYGIGNYFHRQLFVKEADPF